MEELDRVLFRLALLETDAQLEGVLQSLLPALLSQLAASSGPPPPALLQIFGHINKRIRHTEAIKLPFDALLDQVVSSASGGPTPATGFLVLYIKLAVPRLPAGALATYLPRILDVLRRPALPPTMRDLFASLFLRALRGVPAIPSEATARASVLPGADDPALDTLWQFCLDTVLFAPLKDNAPPPAPVGVLGASLAAAAAAQAAAAAATAAAAAGTANSGALPWVAPGLSARAAAAVVGADSVTEAAVRAAYAGLSSSGPGAAGVGVGGSGGASSSSPAAELQARKLDILRLVDAGVIKPRYGLCIAAVAARDGAHAVAKEGEDVLKRVLAAAVGSGSSASSSSSSSDSASPPEVTTPSTSNTSDVLLPAAASAPAPAPVPPGDPLEDADTVAALTRLVLGSGTPPPAPAPGAAPPPPDLDYRSPAPLAVRVHVVSTLLSRSRLATRTYPAALRLIFDTCLAKDAPLKLRLAGARFATLSFRLADTTALAPLAPLLLQGLMKLLTLFPAPGEADEAAAAAAAASSTAAAEAGAGSPAEPPPSPRSPAAPGGFVPPTSAGIEAAKEAVAAAERDRLREATYAAVAALASRVPTPFRASLAVPQLFFRRLATEDASLRLAVAEALSTLAGVFGPPSPSAGGAVAALAPVPEPIRTGVLDLLESYAAHEDARVRSAVIDWACRCFPFADARARYLCMRLVGDVRLEVRDAAKAGLRPGAAASSSSVQRGRDTDADRRDVAGIGAPLAAAEGGAATASGSETEGDSADAVFDDPRVVWLTGAAAQYPSFPELAGLLLAPAPARTRLPAVLRVLDTGLLASPTAVSALLESRALNTLPALSLAGALEFLTVALQASADRAALAAVGGSAGAAPSAAAALAAYLVSPPTPEAASCISGFFTLLEVCLLVSPAEAEAGVLHAVALSSLLRLLAAADERAAARYGAPSLLGWLLTWALHYNKGVRRTAAGVLGCVARALPAGGSLASSPGSVPAPALVDALTAVLSGRSSGVPGGADGPFAALAKARCSVEAARRGVGLEGAHGALLALGHVLGVVAPRLDDATRGPLVAAATAVLVDGVVHTAPLVREGATQALTALARTAPLPLPEGDGSTASDAAPAEGAAVTTRIALIKRLAALVTGGGGGAATAEAPASSSSSSSAVDAAAAAAAGESIASHLVESVAVCIGAIASGELNAAAASAAPGATPTLRPDSAAVAAMAALLSLAVNKYEAVQFTVGQAWVEALTGVPAPLPGAAAAGPAGGGGLVADPLAAQQRHALTDSGLRGGMAALPPLREAAAGWALDAILAGPLQSQVSHQRTAAAVWLVSVLHAAGGASEALRGRLPLIQLAFMQLLGEKNPFTQECAAKGLALLFDAASVGAGGRLKNELVSSLIGMFDTGKKGAALVAPAAPAGVPGAAAAGAASADGGGGPVLVGSIGSGPSGIGLTAAGDSAYKELCAMANDAGQPDLIYRFLALSSHHALWHSRGGASLGLEALLTSRARKELEPHMERLIPRLFRFQYDPVQRVREAMTRLWHALVRDPRAAVGRHIHAILPELVTASQSDNWREREGACLALTDALQGRSWPDVEPLWKPLWVASLRAIDDVKDTVREAGMGMLKTLGKLTLRLCDPVQTTTSHSRACVGATLPFLLHEGVTHHFKDAASTCLGYLREVVRTAGPLLRPHIPDLVATALSSMSAFEHSGLQQLQMHADGGSGIYGKELSGEILEQARISATRSSPFADLLERCVRQMREMPLVELDAPAAAAILAGAAGGDGEGEGGGGGGEGAEEAARPRKKARKAVAAPADGEGGEAADAATASAAAAAGAAGAAAAASAPPASILGALCERLRTLIKAGVGLPARGATARFIVRLVAELTDRMKPHAMTLMRALQAALEDPSVTLRKEFAAAAAALARVCKSGTLKKYIDRLLELGASWDDASLRLLAGRGFAFLGTEAAERMRPHAGDIVAPVFMGCHDPDADVAAAWGEAWSALFPATEHALRLYLSEIVAAASGAVDAAAWVQKAAGARAVITLVRVLTARDEGGSGSGSSSGGSGDSAVPQLPAPGAPPAPGAFEADSVVASPAAEVGGAGGRSPLLGLSVGFPALRAFAGDISGALAAGSAVPMPRERLTPRPCLELAPLAPALVAKLVSGCGGQVWEGKEALLLALGEVVARTGALPAPGGEAGLATVVKLLAGAAGRTSPPLNFTAGAATALVLVLLKHQGLSAELTASVRQPLLAALARVGRAEAAAGLNAGGGAAPAPAPAAPSPAASAPSLSGGVVNEEKESEARMEAKQTALEGERVAALAWLAIALATPAHDATEAAGATAGALVSALRVTGAHAERVALMTALSVLVARCDSAGAAAAAAGAALPALASTVAASSEHSQAARAAALQACVSGLQTLLILVTNNRGDASAAGSARATAASVGAALEPLQRLEDPRLARRAAAAVQLAHAVVAAAA